MHRSPSETPTVVGLNRTQDASISLARGDSLVYSLQKERITRRKHHWGRLGDLPDLYLERMPHLEEPIDLVVECYSSDSEIDKRTAYCEELQRSLRVRGGAEPLLVSHHLAHAYSAFYPSPFSQAATLVADAQGSPARHFTESIERRAGSDGDLLEVTSFYVCERGRIRCLSKQLWDGDWRRPVGLGCFYYLLTRMIFPGEGNEGKVMGLAPFGRAEAVGLPRLEVRDGQVFIPEQWLAMFGETERFRYSRGKEGFQDAADLAAAGQEAFEEAVMMLVSWLHEETGMPALCFAGGIALNCSANGRLRRESPFRENIFIPPSPHDGGTAVGSALYGLVEHLGVEPGFRWVNDFLGPDPDERRTRAAVEGLPDGYRAETPDDLPAAVADLLVSGRVVGISHGRSESGPRALGNRSILADPRNPEMQRFINSRVKGREWFRPLAPIVLCEEAPRFFDIEGAAPFMQFASAVRPGCRSHLPAVTHVDDSARIQTVDRENTPLLHDLLKAFEARTGCPVLLNTSLNGEGQPLVETPADAVQCLQTTDMHALVMPPYLIRKEQEPDVPRR